jgi:hypothetical protein
MSYGFHVKYLENTWNKQVCKLWSFYRYFRAFSTPYFT